MLPESVASPTRRRSFAPLFGADVRVAGRLVEATIDHPTAAVHRLTGWALEAGVELESLAVHRASLEDVYLSLTSDVGTADALDATTSCARGVAVSATSGFPSTAKLLWTQTVYQLRSFRRIPIAVFFTLGLPLIMLVLFNALFGSNRIDTPTGSWSTAQFYTGGLAAFTAVSATFTNLANMVPAPARRGGAEALARHAAADVGVPRRVHLFGGGRSPSPASIVMLTLGVVVYDLDVDGGQGARRRSRRSSSACRRSPRSAWRSPPW